LIFIIDVDGTICTDTQGYYDVVEPLVDRISEFNKLYDEGHEIIYWTARGMTEGNGNVHKAYELYYDITRKHLEDWGVKYHELRMGKPCYDVWIDDKALDPR